VVAAAEGGAEGDGSEAVDEASDAQARLIAARISGVQVVCIYAPNGQSLDSPAFQYKLRWYSRLSKWLAARPDRSRTVLCGDFNIAPADIDVWDPVLWSGQTLASPREREALKGLMDANGLMDVFREQHPEPGRYSWWDYRQLGFPKNRGLRIDYLLVDAELKAACTGTEIDREARKGKQPSDHAPVWAELQI
jgi:exodeoxyribonuclease III